MHTSWGSHSISEVCEWWSKVRILWNSSSVFLSWNINWAKKMSTVLIFFTLLLVLLLTIYLYVKNAYAYWQRRGIPYLEPSFPFGNFKRMFLMEKSFPDTLGDLYNSTSEPFFGVYTITSPALVIRDPKVNANCCWQIENFVEWKSK